MTWRHRIVQGPFPDCACPSHEENYEDGALTSSEITGVISAPPPPSPTDITEAPSASPEETQCP